MDSSIFDGFMRSFHSLLELFYNLILIELFYNQAYDLLYPRFEGKPVYEFVYKLPIKAKFS